MEIQYIGLNYLLPQIEIGDRQRKRGEIDIAKKKRRRKVRGPLDIQPSNSGQQYGQFESTEYIISVSVCV